MSTLRISDAPLLPDVNGTEKIPTGGRGDYAISVDQIKDHIFQDIGKELVGLGNVDNTSDLDKPVSIAQQAALNIKADKTYVDTNLDLKADKTNVYTRSETTLALSQKADLVGGVIPSNQLPSYVDDVVEYTTSTLPIVGESGKIYVTTDTNRTWRWSGNQYVEISNGGVSDSTLKLQTARKIANVDFDGTQDISIPHNNLTDRNVAGAHPASAILDASGKNQQEINDKINGYVVDSWGAKGDGITNDTVAIQAAINELHNKWLTTGEQSTLLFLGWKTYVCRDVRPKAGVHYSSFMGKARLLKTPAGSVTDQSILKWWLMWNVEGSTFTTDDAVKIRHRIENLIFDGNYLNMNWNFGTYEQEQGRSLHMDASTASMETYLHRAKFAINNVDFINSVADGVMVYNNMDVVINNCTGSECFRGGVVLVGGNSKVIINNYVGERANIHQEVDSPGFGGSFRCDLEVNNATIDKSNPYNNWGGLYLSCFAGAQVILNNLKVYSKHLHIGGAYNGSHPLVGDSSDADAKIVFNDCILNLVPKNSVNNDQAILIPPRLIQFNNCNITQDLRGNSQSTVGLSVWWSLQGYNTSHPDCVIEFNGGSIKALRDVGEPYIGEFIHQVNVSSGTTNPKRTIKFNNGVKISGYARVCGNATSDGSDYELNSVDLDVLQPVYLRGGQFGKTNIKVGSDIRVSDNVQNFIYREGVYDNDHKLLFRNVSLPLSLYKAGTSSLAFNNLTVLGQLTLYTNNYDFLSDLPFAYAGTRIVVTNSRRGYPSEYICTSVNNTFAKTWSVSKWNTWSFATNDLPTLTALDVGVQNIDTTLNKLVTWNGTAWI